MTPLYLYILVASISIPLLFTVFYLDVIKHRRNFFISTTIVAIIFLVWDAIFTTNGVWGFNEDYILDFALFKMPIEEWLFFFVIPFCSLFIHFAIDHSFPKFVLGKKTTLIIAIALIAISSVVLYTNYSKTYMVVNFSLLLFTLSLGLLYHIKLLQQFFLTFLVILIPFIIVNGILTGAVTDSPVVWYDDAQNLGLRLVTIPIEDFGYAFTMLFGNLMIFETLRGKRK